MKYLTKEELEDITKELIENPTRETLRILDKKYNNTQTVEIEIPNQIPAEVPVYEPLNGAITADKTPENIVPGIIDQNKVSNQIPALNGQVEMPNNNILMDNNVSTNSAPIFELPKLETPVLNNQNNEPVSFNGNLWELPKLEVQNMMQTTDNFNTIPNQVPTTEVPITSAPFFGQSSAQVNNPIPVGGTFNNIPNNAPSMFGQIEKDYM